MESCFRLLSHFPSCCRSHTELDLGPSTARSPTSNTLLSCPSVWGLPAPTCPLYLPYPSGLTHSRKPSQIAPASIRLHPLDFLLPGP